MKKIVKLLNARKKKAPLRGPFHDMAERVASRHYIAESVATGLLEDII
jgi:hypothetical protein